MFKTVLFPIDMSPEAHQAATMAAELVQANQSRLVLLSVVESAGGDGESSTAQASSDAVASLLIKAQSLFSEQGIDCETLERAGKPAFVICDVADEIQADVIVMGCRGMGLTEEGIADSVTNRVINLSPCPVLIVP